MKNTINSTKNNNSLSWILNSRRLAVGASAAAFAVLSCAALLPATFDNDASAISDAKNTPVSLTLGSVISITAPTNLDLDVTPTASGSDLVTSSGNVIVATNNTTGYTLTMNMKSGATSNALVHTATPSYTIPTLESDTTATDFPVNKWGYSLDYSAGSGNFSALPAIGSTAQLKKTSVPTSPSDTTPFTVGTRADMSVASGQYSNTVTFTAVTNAVVTPTFNGISNMQEMTSSVCAAETTPAASATTETTEHTTDTSKIPVATLTDTRNSKTYKIAKLADGKCWMTENLRLGSATGTTTITSADSDVASSYTLPASSSSWTTSDYSTPQIYYDANNTGTGKDEIFYNFNAATAGTADASKTSGEATGSICPKGWKLPTGNTSGQFKALYTAYGSNYANMNAAFKFAFAGYFSPWDSQVYGQGDYGYWWSSTVISSGSAYVLYADSDGYVNPSGNDGRVSGYSVRCVAGS